MSSKPAPTPAEIAAARRAAGLTQSQAARLVHVTLRTWQAWEQPAGASRRAMPLAVWELFLTKTQKDTE